MPVAALVRDTGTSTTDGITNDGSVAVTLDADVSKWQYSVDGGNTWTIGTSTKSFVLPDGSFPADTVWVKASDLAGNTSLSKLSSALTVDGHGPALQSAYVSMDGAKLVLTYSEELVNSSATPLSAFTVTVGTTTQQNVAVSALAVTGNTVELTLASPVLYGQTVTLGYADPSNVDDANAIQDGFGNDALTLTAAMPVSNFVSSPTASTRRPTVASRGRSRRRSFAPSVSSLPTSVAPCRSSAPRNPPASTPGCAHPSAR